MPRTRLELAHRCRHQPLKLACLPISPSGLLGSGLRAESFFSELCALRSALCASFCAQNRTRTCTSLLTLVPETSASTNFAIWADKGSTAQRRNGSVAVKHVTFVIVKNQPSRRCAFAPLRLNYSGDKNNKIFINK